MAIAINGSGTVTGISVGGLPDGIVDAGTLATNSVDSDELINGSIDAGHLASGVGGKLVNESYVVNTTTTSNTTTTAAASSISAAITPTSASNKMIITLHIQVYRLQTNTGTKLWLYRDIGGAGFSVLGGAVSMYGGYSDAGDDDVHNNVSLQVEDTSYDSTSEVTYTVYLALSHGSGTVKVGQNNTPSSIYVQEITV